MSFGGAFTLIVLVVTIAAFASRRWRSDIIALLIMLSLVISGIVAPEDAFGAFGQPVVIITAAIYVMGAALYDTGVGNIIANQLLRFGGHSETRLLLAIMLTAAVLTAALDGMLVLVLLMPAVLRVARQTEIASSRLLLPLAAAATMGSQITLIGTSSNLMVSDVMTVSGYGRLGLFSLTPYALVSVAVAMLWFLLPGRRLLPHRAVAERQQPTLDEVEHAYRLDGLFYQLRVRSTSDLAGKSLDKSELRTRFHLTVIAVLFKSGELVPASREIGLRQNDVLIVHGERGDMAQAAGIHDLEMKGEVRLGDLKAREQAALSLSEVMIPFRSELVGKTLIEVGFRRCYGLVVLSAMRRGEVIRDNLSKLVLEAGDTLLIQGAPEHVRQARRDLSLVPVTEIGPRVGDLVTRKAAWVLVIIGAMVMLTVSGLMSLATASVVATLALVLTGCVSVERAYQSIDGKILVLLGGMLPLSLALQKTGAAEIIAGQIARFGPVGGAVGTLVLFYLVTTLITQVISNTIAAAIMTPIALNLAAAQNMPPEPFVIATAFAVCTAFITPLTDGNNLLVYESGQYKMRDYVVNGLPIFLIQMIILVAWLI